ncbi:hypothetical protein F4677DRAFT_461752 [Hypoxylon crocopeplum]|nr:hypothetical protein F4677DRAFT_461752 [Hypoxylon crocopeplum]
MRTLLSIAVLSCAANAIHSVSVVSETPYDCDAVGGVDVAFTPKEDGIRANFPTIWLSEVSPAHGYPGGYSLVGCGATVEFEDFPNGRFAIANVTWSIKNLNLTKGDNLYSLRSKVDLIIEHLTNYSPIRYPIVKDKSSAVLIDLDINPGLATTEDYQGEFKLTKENPNPVWSTCYNGYLANVTKLDFQIGASTKGGGRSSPGWSMDFGLIWEKCYAPNETTWGQTIIKGWESCTYRETNQTSNRLPPLGMRIGH